MTLQQNTRDLFLEEFVKRLLIKSLPQKQKIDRNEDIFDKLDKTAATPPKLDISPYQETPPHLEKEIKTEQLGEKTEESQKTEVIEPKESAQERIMRPLMIMQNPPAFGQVQEGARTGILARLDSFLLDPNVTSISCTGPNQNIVVNKRGGIIQTLQIYFTAPEINDFMKDIAEKTKIPLLPGLFKVIYQNLIITAVISEFIGTRFLIEKRQTPNLPPMPVKAQFR